MRAGYTQPLLTSATSAIGLGPLRGFGRLRPPTLAVPSRSFTFLGPLAVICIPTILAQLFVGLLCRGQFDGCFSGLTSI